MADILVNKITISPQSVSIEMGQTARVSAAVSPSNATNKKIIWSVPQGAVASVDQDGNIKPVRIGSSRIIAKSADGNAEAWVSIVVKKSTATITGVYITGADKNIKVVT